MKSWSGWLLVAFGVVVGLAAGAAIFLIARQPSGEPVVLAPRPSPAPIQVHVAGAVEQPGVVRLAPGSRVELAIQQAGGFAPDAASDQVNLAAILRDGQQIYVPRQGETSPGGNAASSAQAGGLVDLNTASLEELMTLPGIGETRAAAIIAYREANGGFKSIEEIQEIEGIGEATFDQLQDKITVGPAP